MEETDIAEVVLNRTVGSRASAIFSYRIPPQLRERVQPGQLVWVPLRNQLMQGVVLYITPASAAASSAPSHKLREISDIADPEATIPETGLLLAQWVAETTLAPLAVVVRLLLPPGVGQDAVPSWRVTPHGATVDPSTLPTYERGVLYYLQQRGETTEPDLLHALRVNKSKLREVCLLLHEQEMVESGQQITPPKVRPRSEQCARLLIAPEDLEETLDALRLATKQQKVVGWLAEQFPIPTPSPVPFSRIAEATGANSGTLRGLEKKGILAIEKREVLRGPLTAAAAPDLDERNYRYDEITVPPLTAGQRQVWEKLATALQALDAQQEQGQGPGQQEQATGERVFLLHGVTGSGKTEIYLRAAAQVLRSGRQVVVLVPEIALTVQLVRRFAARFPGQVAVLHSGLSPGERYDEWRRVRRGDAPLVIGSRSAIFAPVAAPGLIIVDEEHEPGYKNDTTPRYHARSVALRLGKITGSVVVLGSATPAIESYHAAHSGQFTLLEMPERIGSTTGSDGLPYVQILPLPRVHLVDMRQEIQSGNNSIFSGSLLQALATVLDRREQAILFLNRRGAAQFVLCRDCGQVIRCPNCGTPMILHYRPEPPPRHPPDAAKQAEKQTEVQQVLLCHSCSHSELLPSFCLQCLSPRIKSFGIGTQRVEEEVARLFPHARPMRWDHDSATGKDAHSRLFDKFSRREADVLIGTQMISRGLDMPHVSLVGVVAADTGLYLPDFRSGERTFQLMTQVAGRAGRRTAGAHVIIQTYAPEHYALQAAQEHDYHAFYVQEISFRRQTGYPPFGHLVRFVYAHKDREQCQQTAADLAARLRATIKRLSLKGWEVIGPAPAYLRQLRGNWRWHLLIRTPPQQTPLARSLARLLDEIGPTANGWEIDGEPVNVL
jgi:primosomal protein N' (replication factor Y)